jgi:hypothetical protein
MLIPELKPTNNSQIRFLAKEKEKSGYENNCAYKE